MHQITSLPGTSRALLRAELRANAGTASLLAAGQKINDLTTAELIDVAHHLDIDLAAIVAAGTGAAATGTASSPPRPAAPRPAAPRPAATPEHGDDAQDDAQDSEHDAADADAAADTHAAAAALRRVLATALVEGDFSAIDARLSALITEANKPPVEIIRHVPGAAVPGAAAPVAAAAPPKPLPVPRPSGQDTWSRLFGISGANGNKKALVYAPTALTPQVDARYRFPADVTAAALSALTRDRNVWLYGPAGTGKSSFAEQLAARTGRPFFLIPCDDTTEAPELVGMTVPYCGTTRWQDGILAAAMRVPHAIVLIDEPTVARPGAIMVLQSVLASKVLSIKESGEVIHAAEGVRFIVADNTNGTGGGGAEGYEGTRRMNRATLDRFSMHLRIDYLEPDAEAAAIVAHTGCTPELAKILVECATLTRKARVTHALGLRRLIAWAEALTDGIDPRKAVEFCVLNSATRDDREPIEQACALGIDRTAIRLALAGQTPSGTLGATPAPATASFQD